MSTHAHRERLLLADLLDSVGPEAPTLCEGWKTRDLAVHLVVRERRADAVLGSFIDRLAARGERVQDEFRAKPYEELVRTFRAGPPKYSPTKVGRVDDAVNTVEFFIHGEDIRRAQDGWSPRELDEETADALWHRLEQQGRLLGRKSPVGLVLRRPDGQTVVARRGAPVVTAVGEPGELLMLAYGRGEVARVELDGAKEDVEKLISAKMGV
ncbi:TIGR03085 family protein [Mangrovactinospora gilvigrisea]|uniref:TIGR03085 family protein n=1 Tax=Mangrovactinospora gilvigrisea TaxID=1428644 RepID=A0A1J7BPA9_9ACTN|nr:TIGR03085 family metal-binding protein [Mangrovactinospora gilvigrisea]OIV35281.1 TIGR03085 family protein [Mangrovactinospora gilvigrisea]